MTTVYYTEYKKGKEEEGDGSAQNNKPINGSKD